MIELNTIAQIVMLKCIDIKVLDNVYVKLNILIKMEMSFALNAIILGL